MTFPIKRTFSSLLMSLCVPFSQTLPKSTSNNFSEIKLFSVMRIARAVHTEGEGGSGSGGRLWTGEGVIASPMWTSTQKIKI